MKTSPILFRDDMVRAILEGRKTQTRRVIASVPWDYLVEANGHRYGCLNDGTCTGWMVEPTGEIWHYPSLKHLPCPYGGPGDQLWVRETLWVSDCQQYFALSIDGLAGYDVLRRSDHAIYRFRRYQATSGHDKDVRYTHWEFPRMLTSYSALVGKGFTLGFGDTDQSVRIRNPLNTDVDSMKTRYFATFRRRRSPAQMPRWASRLTLEITELRVQQVQEIPAVDAIAEGMREGCLPGHRWVWAITFRRLNE